MHVAGQVSKYIYTRLLPPCTQTRLLLYLPRPPTPPSSVFRYAQRLHRDCWRTKKLPSLVHACPNQGCTASGLFGLRIVVASGPYNCLLLA